MEINHIDIETELSIDEVTKRLRQITLEGNATQNTYHQKFKGEITVNGAKLIDIYSTHRDLRVYELKFLTINSKTVVRVNNNEFDKRQITRGLLIGLLIPFGFIVLILGFMYAEDEGMLIFAISMSLLLILPGFLYKAKPLTEEEYRRDKYIQLIIKTIQ